MPQVKKESEDNFFKDTHSTAANHKLKMADKKLCKFRWRPILYRTARKFH